MSLRFPPATPLACLPTPIHRLQRFDAGVEVWVKRDDLTGCLLSGNKVRKLEFLLADALAQGVDTVITCGGIQSNHCRATAVAAARLGLRCELLLRGEAGSAVDGNLFIDRLPGARVHFITPEAYRARAQRMSSRAKELGPAGPARGLRRAAMRPGPARGRRAALRRRDG